MSSEIDSDRIAAVSIPTAIVLVVACVCLTIAKSCSLDAETERKFAELGYEQQVDTTSAFKSLVWRKGPLPGAEKR